MKRDPAIDEYPSRPSQAEASGATSVGHVYLLLVGAFAVVLVLDGDVVNVDQVRRA
jgi:hypothetical protein